MAQCEKSGKPPMGLIFDILMFSYKNKNIKKNKLKIDQLPLKEKGLTNLILRCVFQLLFLKNKVEHSFQAKGLTRYINILDIYSQPDN